MIKFIVCEDNRDSLEQITRTITKAMMKYDIEYKVIKFASYDKKLKEITKDNEDNKVYILDIELPGSTSGLEIASEIRENDDDSNIIFVTVHSECKDDIFYSRLKAIDFISKIRNYQARLEETIDYVVKKMYKDKVFEFNYNHVNYKLLYKEINYFEKVPMLNKTLIHLTNGETRYINKSIIKIVDMLDDSFFKTHKSCIVNINNIKKIDYANCLIYFKNGDSTELLSASIRKELKEYVRNR